MLPGLFQGFMKNYDVIHFHNETDLSLPFFSYFVKKPKIMHCHCLDVSYMYYKKNPVSREVFKRISDLHVAVSGSIRSLLVDLGVGESGIRVVPNGVDTEIFRPNKKEKSVNLLLFVGRIHPNKGLHVLLSALEHVKSPVQLVVIGPKLSYCLDYYDLILRLIDHLNRTTRHRVTFLGVQTVEELVGWYQRATVFVCPSISEPFGIVNIEALSCGTPVVASNVGGIPEVVKNYQTGLLVEPGVPEELAKTIQLLLDDQNFRHILGNKGREWVVGNFSSEAVALLLRKIYAELLGNN
jgi:glycosyltransferase involved in cell wall biosynthesis